MEISGAKILIESLKCAEVEYIFGVNGGAAMPIFDALYDDPDIKLLPMRHEQGAAHAADGYARATGKPGRCHWSLPQDRARPTLVTGIATAYMDSIPMVVITGQVYPPTAIGSDAFQEVRLCMGVTRPCVQTQLPRERRTDDLAETMRRGVLHRGAQGDPARWWWISLKT